MAYNIDEAAGDILFEVHGDKVVFKLRPGVGQSPGGGAVTNIIKKYDEDAPTDSKVYSSLRTLLEISKALADNVETTDKRYLRKDVKDSAKEKITFEKGLQIGPSYVPGLTGEGGHVDEYGNAELDSLVVRKFLESPEFRFNRVKIYVGHEWKTNGGGIIESVTINPDGVSGTVVLKLEEGELGAVDVDDLNMGIWHHPSGNDTENTDDGIGNFTFAGFATSYFRVTEIVDLERNSIFNYTLRPISVNNPRLVHPVPGMHFAQFGNPTNPDRQSSRYNTTTYERYLVNVTTWEYSVNNIAMQFGDLSNLSIFGLNMTGRSAYLNNIYMTGIIDQSAYLPDRLEFDTSNGLALAFGESTIITPTIYNAWTDVSDKYDLWIWTRDSGNASEDAAWNISHAGSGRSLTVYFSDLLSSRCMFTLTASKGTETIEGQIII